MRETVQTKCRLFSFSRHLVLSIKDLIFILRNKQISPPKHLYTLKGLQNRIIDVILRW